MSTGTKNRTSKSLFVAGKNFFAKPINILSFCCLVFASAHFGMRLLESHKIELSNMDFIQDYFIAKAYFTDISVNTPVGDLAKTHLGKSSHLTHVSPHPATIGLFFIPFALLPIQKAFLLWKILQPFLWLVITRLSKTLPCASSERLLLFFSIFLLSSGINHEFEYGQVNLAKLTLEIASVYFLLSLKQVKAGILLGMAFIFKLGGWALAPVFLMNKAWSSLVICTAVILIGFGASELFLEDYSSFLYFTKVLPENTSLYLTHLSNISIQSFFAKLSFGLSGGPQAVSAGILYSILTLLLITLSFISSLTITNRFVQAVYLISLSSIYLPVSWHYNHLACFFLVLIKKRLSILDICLLSFLMIEHTVQKFLYDLFELNLSGGFEYLIIAGAHSYTLVILALSLSMKKSASGTVY